MRFIALGAVVIGVVFGVSVDGVDAAGRPAWYSAPHVTGELRTITVSPSESLQAAFDAALPGDTILLAPGRH